jgi:hypothetical protein
VGTPIVGVPRGFSNRGLIMHYTESTNSKIGRALSVSRPVGDSCPNSCRFHPAQNGGCWADATERRYPNTRTSAAKNTIGESNRICAMLNYALSAGLDIRLPDRGDFGRDSGKLDVVYVWAIIRACKHVKRVKGRLPTIWGYTHFIRSRLLARQLGQYMRLYASVHSQADIDAATDAGFTLFAYCDDRGEHVSSMPNSRSRAYREWQSSAPKVVQIGQHSFVTCPELRNKHKAITCAGSADSLACKLCCRGHRNVLFPSH